MASPTDISGLVHRFRASQLTGLSNGAAVSSAAFETGGITLTQGTVAARPTYVTSSINNLAGLRFNGSSSYISGTAPTLSPPFSIALTVKLASLSGTQEFLNSNVEIMMNDVAQNTYGAWGGNAEIYGGTPALGAHAIVLTVDTGGSPGYLYVDGTQVATGSPGNATFAAFNLGATGTSRFYNGDIAEMVVYNRVISAADRAAFGRYTQDTYAITMADATPVSSSTSRLIRSSDLVTAVLTKTGTPPSSTQTGSYTLTNQDSGKVIEMSAAVDTVVTIPALTSATPPINSTITVYRMGTGQVTVVGAAGVTVNAPKGIAVYSRYSSIQLRHRASNDWVVSGNATQFYDPTAISNLTYRMRASTIGITTDGSSVANAPFEIGGVTLTSAGSAQPTWYAQGQNGEPYIRFDGIDDGLSVTTGVGSYSQPVTICVVVQVYDTVTSQQIFRINGIEMLMNQDSTTNTWSAYSGGDLTVAGMFSDVMYLTAVFGYNGSQGTSRLYTNGVYGLSGGSGANGMGGDMYIGYHPNTPRFLKADVYEILVYTKSLNDSELAQLHGYIRATYFN